jgi:hypothetical protein
MRWTPCDGIMDFRDLHEDHRIRPKLPRLSLGHRRTCDTHGFHGVVGGCPPSPASSPAPALLFPLLVHTLAITKPSRGRSQGLKECTLYGFAAGFTKLSVPL